MTDSATIQTVDRKLEHIVSIMVRTAEEQAEFRREHSEFRREMDRAFKESN